MIIIYKQVIEVNIEANNVWKGRILSIATGEALTFQTIIISIYTQLYFVTINIAQIYYLYMCTWFKKDILLL